MGEMINWMGGWPKEGVISTAEWEERLSRLDGLAAPKDRETAAEKLRQALAKERLLPTWGVPSSRIVITPGADAAVDWIVKRWLQPGDAVLVERPTSRSALQAFRKAGVVPHATAGDRLGIEPEALSESIRQLHPRLVYAAPDCTDPDGRVWESGRKESLLRRCREEEVAVLLDERQALLSEREWADERKVNSIAQLNGIVLRIGEFPPGMIGGLRLGWLCLEGDEEQIRGLLPDSEARPDPIPLAELQAVTALLEEGIEPIVKTMRFVYSARIGVLIEQLKRQQLEGLSWNEPQSGMHMWIALPEGLDGDALLRASWLNGLLFQPGGAFFASDPDRCKLRVTVAHTEDRWIRVGVQRLGETMADFLGRWG